MAVPEIVRLEPMETVAVRGEVSFAELPEFFATAFGAVSRAVAESGVEMTGPPFGYYPHAPGSTVVLEAGVPVSAPVPESGEVHRLVLPGGRAAQVVHVGPYDTMEVTYRALEAWVAEQGLAPAGPMWESYESDPELQPDPQTWRTLITWLLV